MRAYPNKYRQKGGEAVDGRTPKKVGEIDKSKRFGALLVVFEIFIKFPNIEGKFVNLFRFYQERKDDKCHAKNCHDDYHDRKVNAVDKAESDRKNHIDRLKGNALNRKKPNLMFA